MNLQPNCWNEHGELKTVIVCCPSDLDVPDQQTATDVQWEKAVDQTKARANFENMVSAMEKAGVKVIDYSKYLPRAELQFHKQLINRVFVRDLACVFGNTIIPGKAGSSMRQPEYVHLHRLFQEWFESHTFLNQANDHLKALEFGDVLVLNKDAVFINTGVRTSIDSILSVKEYLFNAGFSEIGIIDLPRRADTLHLDMNCNVAGTNILIAKSYMRLLPVHVHSKDAARYEMTADFLSRHGFHIKWTSSIKHTVADINYLNLNPETLLISKQSNKNIFKSHPQLKQMNLIEIDVTELEKGGGGIRCMTMPVERLAH